MLEEIVWQLVWLVVATLCTLWDIGVVVVGGLIYGCFWFLVGCIYAVAICIFPFYWLGVKGYALFKS
jgi:hypothetical protein